MHELHRSDRRQASAETIPLFPLGAVLFPGCQLELRIFEPRYLSLVQDCMASESGFGVVRIEVGSEALNEPDARQPAVSPVGCYSRILDHAPLASGQRLIRVVAGERFEVLGTEEREDRLLVGRVSWLHEEEVETIPDELEHLVRILRECLEGHPEIAREVEVQDATQVSWWLARFKIQDSGLRQQILAFNNPLERLRTIDQFIRLMEH